MEYTYKQISINELIELIDGNRIDLKPSYQRNDIWSTNDQGELIDSILKGYPLPNFFFYSRGNGSFEMVDGQQRSRTIYRFWHGQIASSKKSDKQMISEDIKKDFGEYKLNVVEIDKLVDESVLQEFYVLVNKKGKHLNPGELNKAEYSDTNFLSLVEDLVIYQPFMDLNLFSETTKKRMNDRSYVEELIAYLYYGITDKKDAVEKLFNQDITPEEKDQLKEKFVLILGKINVLHEEHPINITRYKQKNDFYTLFCFINENINEPIDILKYQYQILINLHFLGVITPSNEECETLQSYALNCVSQSNSKKARQSRLNFFNNVLKSYESTDMGDICEYLEELLDRVIKFKNVGAYSLIDTDFLNGQGYE